MKTTVPHLKNLIRARTNNTGYMLLKGNPFFANQSQLEAMKKALEDMIEQGNENPDRRYQVSGKQQESLKNWLYDLEQKYLYGN
ncbi:hypothetical protein L4D09_26710 [Photobacterium makurazakiensis]|uniref:hypothetical protein n=1 Tax=Photobacterium makurazakiensis TaxID=2910234 RepID=UPI003D0BA249